MNERMHRQNFYRNYLNEHANDQVDSLDLSALSVLRAGRFAAEQEITDRAIALHEAALRQDETLTTLGQLGMEALGLHSDFEQREQYYMRKIHGMPGTRLYARGLEVYANHLAESHSIPVELARRFAKSEVIARDMEKQQNDFAARIAKAKGWERTQVTRVKRGHRFISPFFGEVEEELVGMHAVVGQAWYAESNRPFNDGLRVSIWHTYLESSHNKRKDTPLYTVSLKHEDLTDVECLNNNAQEVIESDLFHPLGLLIAAREAVRNSVPRRISKKW